MNDPILDQMGIGGNGNLIRKKQLQQQQQKQPQQPPQGTNTPDQGNGMVVGGNNPPPPPQDGQGAPPPPPNGAGNAPPVYDPSKALGNANIGFEENKAQNMQYINDLYAAQENARRAQLEAKRTAAISKLNQQATTIKPYYEEQRNYLAGQNQQSKNKFAEFLANRGLTRSGTAVRGESMQNARLQSGLAGLSQSEADAFAEIERQKSLANQDYEINYDAVQQQILSDKTNALLSEKKYADTMKRQLDQDALNQYNTGYGNLWKAWEAGKEDTRNKILDKRYEDTQRDTKLSQQGLVYDPVTGKVVSTYERTRQDRADKISEEDRKTTIFDKTKSDYNSTIGQYYNNFQEEINNVQNDGDPTNDWKIAFLQSARNQKIQQTFQDDLSNISKYSGDFQAEINRRLATPSTHDDALIPYLEALRKEKLYKLDAAKKDAKSKEEATRKENALKIFEKIGIVNTQELSDVLGLPIGTTTEDYNKTQYDISKPYYAPERVSTSNQNTSRQMTTAEKNQSMAQDIQQISSLSVSDAIKELEAGKQDYISVYGIDGYENLWDSVLAKAIKAKQAKKYSDYYR